MTTAEQWRPRAVVCGTGFGRVYLSALCRPGMPFELVGILAQGSARSRECARRFRVPLYHRPEDLPAGTEVACVVVNSAVNGGRGAELAQSLMARGIHVVQEHPLHHDELAECLRQARRSRVVYHLNANYVHLEPVARFVAAARRLLSVQRPLFIDAVSSVQMLYTLFDILGCALGSLRPWSLAGTPLPGAVLRGLDGIIAGIPATLRIQNQMNPRERDNGAHIMHRVTLGAEGGNLLLANTQGPVVWSPRLHMPGDYRNSLSVDDSAADHLDLASAVCLGESDAPPYREIIRDQWPAAAARALLDLRRAVLDGEDPLPRGQYHLAVSRLTADAMATLGPPTVVATTAEPPIAQASSLVLAAPNQRPSRATS